MHCYVAGKGRGKKILLPFQLLVLVGIGITYCVVGGQNLHAFAQGIAPSGGNVPGMWVFIIIFGGLQVFLSMVSMLRTAVHSAAQQWAGPFLLWQQFATTAIRHVPGAAIAQDVPSRG